MEKEESKKYDLVVLGATGFTGAYLVEEVARVADEEKLTWAIAGRNMAKLQKVLSEASSRTGKDLEETPIIIADVNSLGSLDEMASQARAILNVCGPYTLYGEPVIKACIEHGTHHLDLCGEQEFLERMQLLYHAKAKENNALIIGASGTGCLGGEAGLMIMQDQFKDGQLTSVETFMDVEFGPQGGGLNSGTYLSMINTLSRLRELKDVRAQLFTEPLPTVAHKLPVRPSVSFSAEANKWCVPTAGSDDSVVERTIRDHLKNGILKSPVEFFMYLCQPSWFAAWGLSLFISIVQLLSGFSLGFWILQKLFTKIRGPDRKQIEATSFTTTYCGYGFDSTSSADAGEKPKRKVVAKMTGPEPFYVTTSIKLVQSGVTILREGESLRHRGGVLTPGAVFFGTNLLERLEKRNVKVTIVSDTAKPEQ